MKIDKTAFLFLAGAIAAQGAACIVKSGGDDDDGGETTSETTTNNNGGNGGTAGGNGTCDDSVGTPGDCSLVPSVCAEGISDVGLCNWAADNFKPAIGEDAVDCMINLDTSATCEDFYDCRNDALALACTDETADALCARLETDCGTDQAECFELVEGMTDAGRVEVEDTCGLSSPSAEACFLDGIFLTLTDCVNGLQN